MPCTPAKSPLVRESETVNLDCSMIDVEVASPDIIPCPRKTSWTTGLQEIIKETIKKRITVVFINGGNNGPGILTFANGELFDSKSVTERLNKKGVKAYNITDIDEIISKLKSEAKKGDIIVIMSNGSFGSIYKKILKV